MLRTHVVISSVNILIPLTSQTSLAQCPPVIRHLTGQEPRSRSTIHNSAKKTGASKNRKHVKNRELPAAAKTFVCASFYRIRP